MKLGKPDISDMAFRSFVRASSLFSGRMKPYFARFGISPAQWGVLRALHRAEGEGFAGLRLTELGKRMLVTPPSATTLIDRLARMGLVARHAVAADQRARQVRLTGSGRRLVERVMSHRPAQLRTMLGGLSESDQKKLYQLTERMAEHLESAGANGNGADKAGKARTQR